jgi:hypothetical protein
MLHLKNNQTIAYSYLFAGVEPMTSRENKEKKPLRQVINDVFHMLYQEILVKISLS